MKVEDTTHEAFNTMVKYIYKPPGFGFFPNEDDSDDEDEDEDDSDDEDDNEGYDDKTREELKQNAIHCPQKFFDLLTLADKYEISSLKVELISNVLNTLVTTEDRVIPAATVAKRYRGTTLAEISTRMFVECLQCLLESKSNHRVFSQFWALVNNSEEEEVVPLRKRLSGTPFAQMEVNYEFIEDRLDKVGPEAYQDCLFLACSGEHVR